MALKFVKPNPALARELADVSADAEAMLEYLRSPNVEVLLFPTNQVIEICQSLRDLPSGTAEGCRVPLEYARVRLPAIRREFVQNDEAALVQGDDSPPPVLRGMALDRHLRDLIASVATTLDEYRRQATEAFEDTIGPEPFADVLRDRKVRDGIEGSIRLETRLRSAENMIGEVAEPGSERPEILLRRLKDIEATNRIARAELQMRSVVVRWYKSVAARLADYPRLIKDAGDVIDATVDILRPMNERWHKFWEEFSEFGLEQIKKTAATLVEIGEILERRKRYGREEALSDVNSRKLRAEKTARELILAGLTVPQDIAGIVETLNLAGEKGNRTRIPNPQQLMALPQLRHLDVRYSSIRRLNQLEFLLPKLSSLWVQSDRVWLESLSYPNLSHLNLRAPSYDLSFLSKFPNLTSLVLKVDNVTDLSPLASLKKLSSLVLFAASTDDLSVFRSLPQLDSLSVQAHSVRDLSPLSSLSQLQSLSVNANMVSDLSALGALTKLRDLAFQSHRIRDLRPLARMKMLETLSLQAIAATDVSPLENLRELRALSLQGNKARDVTGLGKLRKLEKLGLQVDQVQDLSWLASLTNLSSLTLQANQLTDLTPLQKLGSLTSLNLQTDLLTDVESLALLTNLQSLVLHGPRVRDLSPLSKLVQITSLNIQSNALNDLSALSRLTSLEMLVLAGVKISDLTPIADLKNVRSLGISQTRVTDLTPIKNWRNLKMLNIRGLPIAEGYALPPGCEVIS